MLIFFPLPRRFLLRFEMNARFVARLEDQKKYQSVIPFILSCSYTVSMTLIHANYQFLCLILQHEYAYVHLRCQTFDVLVAHYHR